MRTRHFNIKVFAEGVLIPCAGCTRTQNVGDIFRFTLQMPPAREAFSVLPNTHVQVFLEETEAGETTSYAFAEGYVKGRSVDTDKFGRDSLVLQCEGYDSSWKNARLGLNIGDGNDTGRYLIHQMFSGLSAGDGTGVDVLPGQRVQQAKQITGYANQGRPVEGYLSIEWMLSQSIGQYGPIAGIVHTIANLAGASPLFRAAYNSARVAERIAFRQNMKVAELVAQDVQLEALMNRINSMQAQDTLFQVLQLVLDQTLHHYSFVPSPYFDSEDLKDENPLGETWSGALDAVMGGTPNFAGGAWGFPLQPGQNYVFKRGPKSTGRNENGIVIWDHRGVDLAIPTGTPLLATRDGVARTFWDSKGGGNVVRLDHGNGYFSQYLHLSQFSVRTGQNVRAGQVVGLSGNTGRSTGPHLHFEIRRGNNVYDPMALTQNNYFRVAGESGQTGYTTRQEDAPSSYQPSPVTSQSTCLELAKDIRIRSFLSLISALEMDRSWLQDPTRPVNPQIFYRMVGWTPSRPDRTFSNTSRHPNSRLGNSTAAGAFQITHQTYRDTSDILRKEMNAGDVAQERYKRFDPEMQKAHAVAIMKMEGVVDDILAGQIGPALQKLRNRWVAIDHAGLSIQQQWQFYSAVLNRYDRNATMGKYPGQMGDPTNLGQFQQTVFNSIKEYKPITGALRQLIFYPRLQFAPPPICNVILPDQITSFTAMESFDAAPSRLMMGARLAHTMAALNGNPQVGHYQALHFAPKYLQGIFDVLRGNNPHDTVLGTTERDQYQAIVQQYLARLEAAKEAGVEYEESVSEKRLLDSIVSSLSTDKMALLPREDILRKIADGEEGVPANLLGMYTYDELFRGVIPAMGMYPYRTAQSGTEDAEENDEEIQGARRRSRENLVEISQSVTSRNLDFYSRERNVGDFASALGAKPWDIRQFLSDKSRNIIGQSEQGTGGDVNESEMGDIENAMVSYTELDPLNEESQVVNLYTNYQFAIMRRQARRATALMPLNINMVCGFNAAVYRPSIGWVSGEVISITDTVNTQSKTATTQVSLAGCQFLGDYEDPTWKMIHAEADAEACEVAADGTPESTLLFDKEFSTQLVGQEVYKPLLGVGSVVDWAKGQMDKAPDTISILQALTEVEKAYRNQGEYLGARSEWSKRLITRPIASENDIMSSLLEVRKENEDYKGVHLASRVPKESKQPYVLERRQWAVRYRDEVRNSNMTTNVDEDWTSKNSDPSEGQ